MVKCQQFLACAPTEQVVFDGTVVSKTATGLRAVTLPRTFAVTLPVPRPTSGDTAQDTCSKLFELNSLSLRLRIPASVYSPLPPTCTLVTA
jgi:hypothetical protein